MRFKWVYGTNNAHYTDALHIRHDVFINEQDVPPDLEVDDLETLCEHVILYNEHIPVGTARIHEIEQGVYKIQRVAILNQYRGQGIGSTLMKEIDRYVRTKKGESLVLDAQIQALSFYRKQGFQALGHSFMDAGIPHMKMKKSLV